MPEIGEICRAKELGYKTRCNYVWHACEKCGKTRWSQQHGINAGRGLVCVRCSVRRRMPLKVILTCETCGKQFELYPSRATKRKRYFCSRACRGVSQRTVLPRITRTGVPPVVGEIRSGKDIGRGKLGRTSKQAYSWQPCKMCGKARWISHRWFLIGKSKICQRCYHNNHLTKENHPGWKGGRYTRPDGHVMVHVDRSDQPWFKMVGYESKTQDYGYILEHRLVMAKYLGRVLSQKEVVHHRNGVKDDNRIENLEVMAHFAHAKEHCKGYRDGYAKGLADGTAAQVKLLTARIAELESQANPIPSVER